MASRAMVDAYIFCHKDEASMLALSFAPAWRLRYDRETPKAGSPPVRSSGGFPLVSFPCKASEILGVPSDTEPFYPPGGYDSTLAFDQACSSGWKYPTAHP